MNELRKIICIPFSGGSAYSYVNFQKNAQQNYRFQTVELPGRGRRFGEQTLTNISEMVDDIFEQVRFELNEPYAIYGHSLGATLAFLLTKRIEDVCAIPPECLFVSGKSAPSIRSKSQISDLPTHEFIQKLKDFGGTPDEILSNSELLQILLPIIRADIKASENYCDEEVSKVSVPIHVFQGLDDKISYSDTEAWRFHSSVRTKVNYYKGNHFFIYNHSAQILDYMHDVIEDKINAYMYY